MATITDANGSSTTLTGTKTNDTIDATGADATMSAQNINSGNANDTIFGGGGYDKINGGAGIDTAVYLATLDSLSASSFSWSGNTLIVRAGTSEGTDQLVNVEYLLFGAKKDESGQFVGDKVSINGAVAKFDTFTVDENPTGRVSMDALANDFSLKAGATLSDMTLDGSRIAQTGDVVAKTADGKVDIVLGSDGKLTFGPLTPATVYDFVAL